MSSDFDSFLDKTVQRLGDEEETRRQAFLDEKEQRQLFLRAFRDSAQNVLLPVLNRVYERRTKTFGVEVNDAPESVELRLTLGTPSEKPTVRTIQFVAEFRSKRVHVSYNTEAGHFSSETEILELSGITNEKVEELVRRLIERKRSDR
jgi:hypothetical protein